MFISDLDSFYPGSRGQKSNKYLALVIEDFQLLILRLYYEKMQRYRSPPPAPLIIAARPQIGHKAAQQPIQKRQPALKLSGPKRRSRCCRRRRCFPMKLHQAVTAPGQERAHPALHPLAAVLRIHDILGWIRIRIRGSMPLTNGSGSCNFRH